MGATDGYHGARRVMVNSGDHFFVGLANMCKSHCDVTQRGIQYDSSMAKPYRTSVGALESVSGDLWRVNDQNSFSKDLRNMVINGEVCQHPRDPWRDTHGHTLRCQGGDQTER